MAKGGDLEKDMKYDYRCIGREYEQEILNEAESQGRQLTSNDLQKLIEEKLVKNNPQAYCERLCLKMGHYAMTLYNKEILSMQADFYQDDNGLIWFYYARKIILREPKQS